MTVQALLSLPVVQTLSPVEVFALLTRTAAAERLRPRVTSRTGSPMLECFADLVELDAQLDASMVTPANEQLVRIRTYAPVLAAS